MPPKPTKSYFLNEYNLKDNEKAYKANILLT